MKRMIKRMAAVGAALLLVLAAGCGQQTLGTHKIGRAHV